MSRLLVVGLDPPEITVLRERLEGKLLFHEVLPSYRLVEGVLYVEGRDSVFEKRIDRVVFHGIFDIERDFDFLTALALWRGPCYPSAQGLLDCRLRLPCLARALRVTRFGSGPRGLVSSGRQYEASRDTVAKWSNWHCGENKHRFTGEWSPPETAVFEPFFPGEAVRVAMIGDKVWQIRLRGEDWLRSIHHPASTMMPIDPELLDDTKALANHFGLEVIAVDYMVADTGEKHLLEVNHVPNVTVFPEMQEAFFDEVVRWNAEHLAAT